MLIRESEIVDFGQKSNPNYWNVTLLEDPLFSPDYISFVMDGSYHTESSKNGRKDQTEFPLMPIYVGDHKDTVKVQLFISEIALNQAMSTLFQNGQLIKGSRVPSTYVKTLIPNFEEVFGKHTDVLLLVEALAPPQIEIRTNQTKFNAEGSLRLLNPYRDEFDAVQMKFVV